MNYFLKKIFLGQPRMFLKGLIVVHMIYKRKDQSSKKFILKVLVYLNWDLNGQIHIK